MIRTIIITTAIFFSSYPYVLGQLYLPENNDKNSSSDNPDIFTNDIFIRAYFLSQSLDLSISRVKDNEYLDDIDYEPAYCDKAGIEVNINSFGISFYNTLSNTREEIKLQGKSEFTDIWLTFYTGDFGIELLYQKYNGFHLSYPEEHGYHEGDPETKRPDLKMRNIGGRFYYNLLELNKYSIAANFNQTEKHRDCLAIAFLAMVSFDYSTFDSDYSLITPDMEAKYDKYSGLTDGKMVSLALSPGLAASISALNIYATTALFIGGGYQNVQYTLAADELKDNTGFLKMHLLMSTGYNGENILAGMTFICDFTCSEITEKTGVDAETDQELRSGLSVDVMGFQFKMFAGIRF